MARLGRFLTNEACLDTANDMRQNGEFLLQQQVARQHSGAEPIILDVGANVGLWSHHLVETFRAHDAAPRVYSMEPCAETFQTLRDNVSQWDLADWISPQQLAFSSDQREMTFYSLGPNQGRNGFHPPSDIPSEPIVVCTRTIDDWCREQGIQRVALLKIDAEGHDMDVIEGAAGMLESQRIDMVQFEYNHRWISSRRYLKDAFEFFDARDYRCSKITRLGVERYDGWHYELESFREANFLAISASCECPLKTIQPWFKN